MSSCFGRLHRPPVLRVQGPNVELDRLGHQLRDGLRESHGPDSLAPEDGELDKPLLPRVDAHLDGDQRLGAVVAVHPDLVGQGPHFLARCVEVRSSTVDDVFGIAEPETYRQFVRSPDTPSTGNSAWRLWTATTAGGELCRNSRCRCGASSAVQPAPRLWARIRRRSMAGPRWVRRLPAAPACRGSRGSASERFRRR